MKLFQKLVCMALTATATASLSICAFAADYTFDTAADTDYYPSTSYEDTYGTAYHYGSKNLVDYQIPELPYGVLSTTQTGVMEKLRLPGLQQTVGGSATGIYGVDSGVGIPAVTPVIPSYVPFDGDKCDFLQNAAVCSCHSSQRFRCSPVDRADPHDCQGRTESRRHCNTHRLKSRYHRRLSGKRTPRHADLYGGSQCGFSNYKGSGQVRRKRRQRRCAQRAVRRPPHGRAQRRSWQHGGVCPAKRSAAKQHKSKHITTVVCCAKRLSTYRRAAITLAGKVRPICCAGQYA